MVWGLMSDLWSREHSPNGKWLGYEERLTEYFDTQVPDGPLKERLRWPNRYHVYAMEKFHSEPGSRSPYNFLPIEAPLHHEWPDTYQTKRTQEKLGALLITESGFLAVEERLKALIEALEPGVHDFRPIRIVTPRGKDYPAAYHVLRIGNFRDSFRPDLTDSTAIFGAPDNYTAHATRKHYAKVAMSLEAIGGAHLWRERTLTEPSICLSDHLQDAITMAGLRLMKHWKMKSV